MCGCYSNDCDLDYIILFFFKQKTAYYMRISDWSSDVCSSDLTTVTLTLNAALPEGATLSSTGGTVTQDLAGDPSGKTYTISGDVEAIIDGLQVTVPGGYEGTISGTITTTSTEADRKSTRLNSSH